MNEAYADPTKYSTDQYHRRSAAMRMDRPLYADPEGYAINSPGNHTAAIHTPLLMARGTLDTRGSI